MGFMANPPTHPQAGIPALQVRHVWVKRKNKWILKDIAFDAERGKFLAVIGPNGAGKTTLFKAIAGERPTHGEVLIEGESIYESPEYWLQRVGYVPVDNVLHESLTVQQALQYVGRLRLPQLSAAEIDSKIAHLLNDFDISAKHLDYVRTLSSGEKKRVNICAELLTDPTVLLLDEPTSNLDPNAELQLMQKLRELAHSTGKTILIISHTLNTINECDRIVFVENSTAKPAESPQTVLAIMETQIDASTTDRNRLGFERWAHVFEHFKTRSRSKASEIPSHLPSTPTPKRAPPDVPLGHQFRLLLRRYARIRLNDLLVFLFTLAFGLIGGLFLFVLPPEVFLKPESASEYPSRVMSARQAVFIMSLIVSLIGLIAGYQEISREFRIYIHERAKGQSPLAYVLAKWFWLALAVGIVAPVLLIGVFLLIGQQFPNTPLPQAQVSVLVLLTLIFTCIAAVSLGLAISAVAGGRESLATALLAIIVIFHVLFSGLIKNKQIEDLINTVSVLATSRWAFEGFSSGLGLYCWASIKQFDEFNSFGHLASVWLASTIYSLVAIGIAVFALRARDSWLTLSGLGDALKRSFEPIVVFVCVVGLLTSWALFIRTQSQTYHGLTFYDREYGGFRFLHVEEATEATQLQHAVGLLSQSQCNHNLEGATSGQSQ